MNGKANPLSGHPVGFPRASSTLICLGPEKRTSSWPAGQGLHKQAGHMAASASSYITQKTTCQTGPSTYGNPILILTERSML